ncbi:thiol-disulfide oxidoreductase DCC family protein [Brevundimonas sp.]|uniref:thiol-disulfide oxidoreductase DCC family protein n=1 Tax=Brevundimonas sp. TaxID=1871086 RepID=UPI0024899EBC|nr:DCC1-like thiol-disulfide oxidoreductase family protein [Brevundimonas sp.]MDI1281975.1 DCC1-like thiol-disulfide oxidoreductase family protein [Brevundimonas sp.]
MARPAFSYRSDPAVPAFADDRPVVIYDGDCPICSRSARMVLRHDRRGRFRLMAAGSAPGRALYAHYALDLDERPTMILLQDGRAWLRSGAVLRIAAGLGGVFLLTAVFRAVPEGLRDRVYDFVARNRMQSGLGNAVCVLTPGIDPDRILG